MLDRISQRLDTLVDRAARPRAPTYRADIGVVAGGAGYAAELVGSPFKVVRVHRVFVAKPSVEVTIRLIKAKRASTVGTSTNATAVALDSQSPDATATVKLFTAAPTAGAAIGDVFEAVVGTGDVVWEDFADVGQGGLVLRGSDQALGVNVSAAATLVGYIEWSESED